MDDVSRLIDSALEQRGATLRKGAMGTIVSMGPDARVGDLLKSEAAATIRSLTLQELAQALAQTRQPRRRRMVGSGQRGATQTLAAISSAPSQEASEDHSDVFEGITSVLANGPLTIGQIGRELGLETPDLRTYLQWMLKDGRLTRSGKARATRYHLA